MSGDGVPSPRPAAESAEPDGDGAALEAQQAVQAVALEMVLEWLRDCQDVVSVGQVCRTWRRVARDPYVWRHRHAPDVNRPGAYDGNHDHPDWGKFWRVARFAPCVRKMSVEQPSKAPPGSQRHYDMLGSELNLRTRGLRVRFELDGFFGGQKNRTPAWVYRMVRRLAPHLEMLEVENPGPEDVAFIRSLFDEGASGTRLAPYLRILHCRTWSDKLEGVAAWPARAEPTLDLLHVSLIFAGTELVRVFGRTARRLELEVNTPDFSDSSSRLFTKLDLRELSAGHVREVVFLRDAACVSLRPHNLEGCRQQTDRVRQDLPQCRVLCSACERRGLCRC